MNGNINQPQTDSTIDIFKIYYSKILNGIELIVNNANESTWISVKEKLIEYLHATYNILTETIENNPLPHDEAGEEMVYAYFSTIKYAVMNLIECIKRSASLKDLHKVLETFTATMKEIT